MNLINTLRICDLLILYQLFVIIIIKLYKYLISVYILNFNIDTYYTIYKATFYSDDETLQVYISYKPIIYSYVIVIFE